METYHSDLITARIHTTGFPKRELYNAIKELLEKGEEYIEEKDSELGNFIWVFGDFDFIEDINDGIIFGKLGKNREVNQKTRYDKKLKKFNKEITFESSDYSVSRFVISSQTNTILFEEKKSKISQRQFVSIFTKMFNKYFDDLSSIKIDPVLETTQVFQWINKQDKLISVSFSLSPSNPSNEPDFKRLDELLRETKTEAARLFLENGHEGLNPESLIINQAVRLSGAGYGNYSITGEENGKKTKLVSKDSIRRQALDSPNEDGQIKNRIIQMLRSITNRQK